MAARCGSRARGRCGIRLIPHAACRCWRRRLSLPQFKLLRPRTLGEALEFLAQYAVPDSRGGCPYILRSTLQSVVAGGTDLIPSMHSGCSRPSMCSMFGMSELRGIRPRAGAGVEIGALTTLSEDRAFRIFCAAIIRCCRRRRQPSHRRSCATWGRSAGTSAGHAMLLITSR